MTIEQRRLHVHLRGTDNGAHWRGRLFVALQHGDACRPGREYTAGRAGEGEIVLRSEELDALEAALASAPMVCVSVDR